MLDINSKVKLCFNLLHINCLKFITLIICWMMISKIVWKNSKFILDFSDELRFTLTFYFRKTKL